MCRSQFNVSCYNVIGILSAHPRTHTNTHTHTHSYGVVSILQNIFTLSAQVQLAMASAFNLAHKIRDANTKDINYFFITYFGCSSGSSFAVSLAPALALTLAVA
jgi:hypothetical protein